MSLINIGIIITYVMILGGALTILGFSILKVAKNEKKLKKNLYSLGVLVGVFLISYLFASGEVLSDYEKYNITSSSAKRVGMGLNTFYLLAVTAFLIVIYTEIVKVFKK